MNFLRTFGAAILVALLLSFDLYGQSPGAVSSNLSFWLKANAGPEEGAGDPAENGDAITTWLDMGPGGRHYIATPGPTLVDNALNFNPTVQILSGGFDAPIGSELTAAWTVITISRKVASDLDGRVFEGNTGNWLWSHWGQYTNSIYLSGNPSNYNSGIATTTGIQNLHLHAFTRAAGGAVEARADGTSLTTFGTSSNAAGVRIDINSGAFSASENSDSEVGEFIVYNSVLTPAELLRVESYLAIKYGITVTHNYVTTSGSVIWDYAANTGFNHDIAGVGAEAATALDQRRSKSINLGSWITLDKGGVFPIDESYLMWGDNDGIGISSNIPSTYSLRSARIWKAAVSGTPGDVTFTIDLAAAGLPVTAASDYTLLLDNDTDFSSGATTHTIGASLVGNTLSFTNVPFTHNQFFTVALANFRSPAGVPGTLATWLKADGDVWEAPGDQAESGDAIATWRDMSGQGHHYTAAVAGPTLQNTTVNFNPSVEILNGGLDAPAGSELQTDWTTFFVSRKLASDPTGRVFDGHTGNYLWAWWDTFTNSLYLNGNPANHNTGIASTTGITNLHLHTYKRQASGALEARADGTSLTTYGSSASAAGIRIDIDNGAYSGESSDVRVGEMIIYNSSLSAADVNKIESYLAIKYGITLTHDYVDSDGTTLWNLAGNAGYNNDITGIGRDDITSLAQTKSTSINSSTDITFDNGGAFGGNKSFLMWGNNGATGLGFNVPSAFKIRSNKIWKTAVSGTPGVVSFSINLSANGIPNTGSAADYALLIDTDTDFSTVATTHTAGASLVGNVLTFTGVSFANNDFFTIATANINFPGGVPNLSFWVKGDVGTTGTTDVSQWADQSGNGNHAVQAVVANQPGLVSNNINFHSVINFTGNSDIFNFTTPPANLNSTVFTVAAPTANTQWRTMLRGTVSDHPLIVEQNAVRLGYYDNDIGFRPSGFNWLQNEIAVVGLEMKAGDVNFRKNGAQGSSINTINLSGLNLNYLGNYQGNNQQFGRIAETIIYNGAAPLTTTEKEKIESYLGIKYGVTLTHNYLASDATVLWNTTTNAAYNNQVAGIGRDDNSALDQQRSISSNTGAGLTIDKGAAFGTDRDFLVWGADNGTATSYNVPTGYVLRSGRTWKTAVTGTPGAVTVSIDLTTVTVPNTGNASDYALLKDTDTDFTSGATAHTTGANIVGNILSFTNVSFATNDVFAIAVANLPLPGGIAGGVFWVKGEVGVVGTTDVSQWTDQSGFANHAVQATVANQPTAVSNSINFRTVVDFNASADRFTLTSPPQTLNSTIFTVAAPTVNSNWRTMWRGTSNDHPVIVETGTTRLGYYDADGGAFRDGGFTWSQNEVALVSVEMRAGDVNFRKNGTQGSPIGTINLTGIDLFSFGNYQAGTQPFGRIAEAIVYNTASAITSTDKEKIESYLAIKYGITLSHNYVSGSGIVAWNTTTNSTYNNNVTGVGRDDISGLNQTLSLGVHSNATVTVQTAGAIGTSDSFLLFGDDGGTGTSSNVPPAFLVRSGRVWKAAVTGTPGAVSVSFNLNALGLPNTGAASDFAVLIDTDNDFSTGATLHTAGASLVGSTLTFTSLNLTDNNFFTLAASNLVLPGGLFGAAFWVKGDVGVTGTTDVSQWNDQTGNNRHAVQGTVANQPALVTNAINSHSVIDFTTSTDFFNITSPPANLNATAFILGVPKVNTTWRTFLRGTAGDHPMLVETGGTQVGYYDPDGGTFRPGGFTWLQNETAIVTLEMRTGDVNFRKNGAQGASITTVNLSGQNLNFLGNYSGGTQAAGRIAEAIIFTTASAISDADKQKVESYLAIKYGVTLTHNYVTTDGTVFWNTTTNATYNNEVAGIGRDNVTGLDQRRSISVNTNAVVTMDLGGAFPVDKSYLVWGNNTGVMNSSGVTDLPVGVVARLARVWKIGKTGTVGAVTVQVNLNAVPGSKTAADLRLLVDRDMDGTFADETSGGNGVISGATSLGGGLFQFTGVTFNDGEFFTIGSAASTTPLPVILTSFDARLTDAGVKVSWETVTEINNDYFTISKSRDGAEFFEVGVVAGAGNTTTSQKYEFIDPSPLPGRSYYRLSQTDFDGRVERWKVAMIQYEPSSAIYPNPATHEVNLDIDDKESFAAEIVNSIGQKVYVKQTLRGNRITWNVESLPRGIYFIRILRNGLLTTQKLVLAD